MVIAGAHAIANYAEKKGLNEDYIIPPMSETGMFIEEAVTIGLKAIEQGVARKKISRRELTDRATAAITRPQDIMKLLMKGKIIQPPP